jgi:hypothetical protein
MASKPVAMVLALRPEAVGAEVAAAAGAVAGAAVRAAPPTPAAPVTDGAAAVLTLLGDDKDIEMAPLDRTVPPGGD